MIALVLTAALAVPADGAMDVLESAARIPLTQQEFAACVSHRESRHSHDAVNEGSGAAGRWQFEPQWKNGLPYMVAKRLRQHGMNAAEARAIRKQLQAMPIVEWSPLLQDTAFVAVLNARGPWSGWRHWAKAGSPCNDLVPVGAR